MKKGFTLIELLAVIVILAIIALIATPIILGIINDAREESNERSVELYASAVRNGIAAYQLREGKEVLPGTYNESNPLPFEPEYDGKVDCANVIISETGKVSLDKCTVNGGTKEYSYGIEEEPSVAKACTRQNDEEGFDTVTCTIGENTESFYVMNSYLTDVPSDKIVMMTKYNIDPTTYRQSSSAGTVAFSSTNYWSNETTYPVDVYDERNDIIKPIVDNYVSYLNGSLIEDATGSLLTYNQAKNLGCDDSSYSCSSAPTWVYSTSYWVGSAADTIYVWNVDSGGRFYDLYDYVYDCGVRPVITISTSEI